MKNCIYTNMHIGIRGKRFFPQFRSQSEPGGKGHVVGSEGRVAQGQVSSAESCASEVATQLYVCSPFSGLVYCLLFP